MASIIKRNNSWRASIFKKGIRKTATFDTRHEAEIWARRIEADILDFGGVQQQDIVHGQDTISMLDLFSRYAEKISPQKKGVKWELVRLKAFRNYPIFSIPVHQLTPQKIALWRDSRLKKVTGATVNRDLNLISSVITMAIKEWGLDIPSNPVRMIKRPPVGKARDRRISKDEKNKIANSLKWDGKSQPKTVEQWVAFALFLALETAMRRSEITSIKWKNVFLDKSYIHLETTKNGESRNVPLSNKAKDLINLLEKGNDNAQVVPISPGSLTTLFRRSAKRCGLENIRFHDSRREATTQLAEKLSNVLELSAVTGHKSLNVLKGYYRPNPSDLAAKINKHSSGDDQP